MKLANGRQPIDQTVTYRKPVYRKTKLGSIPHDYHSYSSHRDRYYTSCDQGVCNGRGREIWRRLPTYNPDGSLRLETVEEQITAYPDNPIWGGLKWGVIGGAVGAALGLVTGLVASTALGATMGVGATLGGALGAAYGANDALQDRIRLEWQEKPIHQADLAGYYHDVDSRWRQECGYDWDGDWRCRSVPDGYDHEFRPDIQLNPVGTYVAPVVVHYREE